MDPLLVLFALVALGLILHLGNGLSAPHQQ
jgi:hypothetical protein